MNKSIEFIISQINEGKVADNFPKEKWSEENSDIHVLDFFEVLKYVLSKYDYDTMISKNKLNVMVTNENEEQLREVQAKIDTETDYQYFLSKQTVVPVTEENMDITYILFNLTQELFQDIGTGKTYYIQKHPKDYDVNYFNYDLKYTLGNLIVKIEEEADFTMKNNSEEGKEAEEQVVKGRLVSVILPVAVKYSKRKVKEEVKNNG